jgi:uncharacterized protein
MARMKTWIAPNAQKGVPSRFAGRGVVARDRISAGEVVAVKAVHVVDRATLLSLPALLQNSEIGISDRMHLVAPTDDECEDVMLFLNHSCDPKVGVRATSSSWLCAPSLPARS